MVVILLCCGGPAKAEQLPGVATINTETWLMADSANNKITVIARNKIVKIFTGAAFGRGGVGLKTEQGDQVTPKGMYKIGWKNSHSQFRHFFGLNYPSIADANRAIAHHKISKNEYFSIIRAQQAGRTPPQNTALGGQIGIHGLGGKSIAIHQSTNWTFGCIALTNQQIDELSMYVTIGTWIVIG